MSDPVGEALERLKNVARTLNEQTDAVNSIIESANKQLAAMNVGVTLWLSQYSSPVLLDASGDSGQETGWQLGYAKIDDAWQIAVRRVTTTQKFFEGDERAPYTDVNVHQAPIALMKASRIIRIEACGHLARLLENLALEVERLLKGIHEATTSVLSGSRK